jgi:hypothetical protein
MLVGLLLTLPLVGQSRGTTPFQNFDFENGSFVPIVGDQYSRVSWSLAMPGWNGFVGTNQVDRLLHNNFFLGTAGINIWGPDNPGASTTYNGHYYVQLQRGLDPVNLSQTVSPSITQTGDVPTSAQSIRVYSGAVFSFGVSVFFNGSQVQMFNLGLAPNGGQIWGGSISQFAGQTGELKLRGDGVFDFIHFSNQPIPEPSVFSLFGLGALLFYHRSRLVRGWRA